MLDHWHIPARGNGHRLSVPLFAVCVNLHVLVWIARWWRRLNNVAIHGARLHALVILSFKIQDCGLVIRQRVFNCF